MTLPNLAALVEKATAVDEYGDRAGDGAAIGALRDVCDEMAALLIECAEALRQYGKEESCPDCDGTRTVFEEDGTVSDCGWCGMTGFVPAENAWDQGLRARDLLARLADFDRSIA